MGNNMNQPKLFRVFSVEEPTHTVAVVFAKNAHSAITNVALKQNLNQCSLDAEVKSEIE